MSVGRNDPCPCGSGKKYKKCCLAKDEAARPGPDPADETAALRGEAMSVLSAFSGRPELGAVRRAAFEAFMGAHLDRPPDEELVDDVGLKFAFYFFFDHELDTGESPAERFLGPASGRATRPVQGLIRRLAGARLRPYEVEEVRADEGLTLHDLWSDQRVFVTERAATRELTQWDVLVARVAPEDDGTRRLEGGIYLIPTRLKQPLMDALKKEERRLRRRDPGLDEDRLWRRLAPLVHRFWLDRVAYPPPPRFVTAEGDPMEFGRVTFDVFNRDGVESALREAPGIDADDGDGRFHWVEEPTMGFTRSLGSIELTDDGLTLEVTSRQRASRGRRLLERAAGDALRHRATRFGSVRKAMERMRSRRPADEPSPVPPEDAARILSEYKQRHYRTWPDMPLPALAGRTPRHAARLKTLRPRVVDLLKDLENHESRDARPDNPPYDFGWLWRELGLEKPA